MNRPAKWVVLVAIVALAGLGTGACKKTAPQQSPQRATVGPPIPQEQVDKVVEDLRPWADPKTLPRAEGAAFMDFCHFLAARLYCDAEIDAKRMTEQEAVDKTQLIIDRIVETRGSAIEDVLLKFLEARKSVHGEERLKTYCKEHPEVYAAVIIWKMKSKRAIPLLAELAVTEDISNRAVFARALGRIGDRSALPFLREMVEADSNLEVKREADQAFKDIEEATRPAQPEPTPQQIDQGRDARTTAPAPSLTAPSVEKKAGERK